MVCPLTKTQCFVDCAWYLSDSDECSVKALAAGVEKLDSIEGVVFSIDGLNTTIETLERSIDSVGTTIGEIAEKMEVNNG